jgi:hypothetical protein
MKHPAAACRSAASIMVGCVIMAKDDPSDEHQVLSFRSGRPVTPPVSEPTPVEDLSKFRAKETPEEYRHRMMVNVAAFAFVAALVGGGLWLADTMAQMRKNQDCVSSGRRNCVPIEYSRER